MKKLFLGCGILLLIGLGTLGYVGYQLWPDISHAVERAEAFNERMLVLEREHPFDAAAQTGLDTERFVSYLELRIDAKQSMGTMLEDLRETEDRIENKELGFVEAARYFIQRVPMSYDFFGPLLEQRGMGPSELGWHTRVLWATLESVESGAGADDPQLNRLAGRYYKLRDAYKQAKHENGVPLEKLLAGIDPAVVRSARLAMALDIDRVEAGLLEPDVEAVFLMLSVGGFDNDVDLRIHTGESDASAAGDESRGRDEPVTPEDG